MSVDVAPRLTPLAPPRPTADGARAARLDAIDLLRGLVVALMVLDHVREYWSRAALLHQPTDLLRTTPALFLTRWVTHLCAPTFVFLAGASVYLQWARAAGPRPTDDAGVDADRRTRAVAWFQVRRGLWLVALEATVVSFGFDFGAPFVLFQVIWAIGLGLVLLAPLLGRPTRVAALVGVAALLGGDALGLVVAPRLGDASPLAALAVRLLVAPGPAAPLPGFVAYPALPWFGVLCLGYAAGPLFRRERDGRRRALLACGGAALALFVLARAANVGDPARWAPQATPTLTLLSFLNVSKYPPSPLFVLVTLGTTLPLCALLDRPWGAAATRWLAGLRAFGRAPMATYLVHVYVVHGLALLAGVAWGLPARAFTRFLEDPSALRDAGWGLGLAGVYVVWALVCLLLVPFARAYDRRRTGAPRWWMRYV